MTTEKIKDHYSDDVRLALLEQSINNINNTLVRFEKRFDNIDSELREIRNEFSGELKGVRGEFKSIRSEMKSDFRWIVTIFGGLMLGLAGIMTHGFHWL